MKPEVLLAILGMAIATYIPRALPAAFWKALHFSPKMEQFLKLIPYTAMTALVFPGVFYMDPANWHVGLVGGLVAVGLSWFKSPLALTVLFSVLAVFLTYLLF